MTEAKIAKLKIKRNTLIAQQQRVKEFIDSRISIASVQELDTRLQALEKYHLDFQNVQAAIEELEVAESTENVRATYEELYFSLRPIFLITISDYKRKVENSDESFSQGVTSVGSAVKLPKIPLPTFSGDYTQWLSYYETFSALVHRNAALDNVTRFYYLRSSLRDGALRRIQSIEVTSDNYDVAVQLLVERYQKRNIIVREHIRQLFNIPSIANKTSAATLRDLIDSVSIQLRALTSLGRPVAHWDDLIIELVLSKLDNVTLDKWNDEAPTERLPTLDELIKFLDKRCNYLEERSTVQRPIAPNTQSTHMYGKAQKPVRPAPLRSAFVVSDNIKPERICTYCNASASAATSHALTASASAATSHALTASDSAATLTVNAPAVPYVGDQLSATSLQPAVNSNISANSLSVNARSPTVTILLATALIHVINKWGEPILCRTLLDSGSQLNFVSERLAVQLGIRRKSAQTIISGIGNISTTVRHSITTIFRSMTSSYSAELNYLVLPRIGEHQPEFYFDISLWNLPADIHLADPAFHKSQKIDMLLGAEIFIDLLIHEQIRLSADLPILQNTKLGWIVTGKVPAIKHSSFQCSANSKPTIASLELLLRQFWELEAHSTPSKMLTSEERLCEMHFTSTVKRINTGRFIVRLPFKEPPTSLGNSFTAAKRRFLSLERKLVKDSALRQQYIQFMRDYESLNHMTRLQDAYKEMPENNYFLPHHCVIKADSSSTKLRVVFDASAKTTSNLSLNEILMIGPTVQSDLFTVITRFRTYRYVVTSDISKMYRQMEVDPQDCRYQLILWRENPLSQLGVYQLNTVTYGTSAAPYLATRCLTKLAEDEKQKFPMASRALLRETYVDDIMTGANTEHEAASLLAEIQTLLTTAQLELRKYCSNNTNLLSLIPEDHKEPFMRIGDNDVIKTLGLIWQPTADAFNFHFNFEQSATTTKRTVLSDLGKIFDPLGLIGPVVVLGKIFMQQLWKENFSWDQQLPDDLERRWNNYLHQLKNLNSLQIPRYLLSEGVKKSTQLHSFSDSSNLAYGACCYLRSVDENDKVTVQLVCSKSRVAPATFKPIANLELQAALLMAELVERLLNVLPVVIDARFFYTDSKTVLSWIARPSYTWTTFVANRVAKIQELTRIDEWGYINTKQNPADIVSRGSMPDELIDSTLWKCGPDFLLTSTTACLQRPLDDLESVPERRPNKFVLHAAKPFHVDLTTSVKHRESLQRLERIFAYCIRFINNAKNSADRRITGRLTASECSYALSALIRNTQRSYLAAEYNSLVNKTEVDKSSRIKGLGPFMDSAGLIRVDGRLHNSSLPYRSKHQIILPKKCNLTKILVCSYHFKHLHAGPQTLHSIVRQSYWPIDGLNLCRSVVHRCVRCFRTKPSKADPYMGSLPKERVQPGRAFLTTGIDFCGPVPIHTHIRGRPPAKGYVAIFVCFTTKAVHIEVVSDLSTAAFIAALRRFIARRGLCKTIFSDNATNFLGAKNELAELHQLFHSESHQSALQEFVQQDRIEWRTIPPRSPHFGGLWEAAVKQAKHHLTRVVAFEELTTITAQIEAILNSRPLTPLSSDPADMEALTPGHFLIGAPLTSFPEPDVTEEKYTRLVRFRRLQQLQQQFWRRWSTDYLHLLQQRHKWTTKNATLQPGTLVVVHEDNLPPYKWALARVISTIPGRDGIHRVAEIKTQHGTYKRAIVKLYPLPIDD